jgi:hypothetical protein
MTHYEVLRNEEGWQISLFGRLFGPYPSQECAVRAAVNAAEARARNGRAAEVLVREGERVRLEWSGGRERLRPTG